jgi:hypothetical protein
MTTVRLTGAQKRRIREATKFLSTQRGRRVTQGEAVLEAVEFALNHKGEWMQSSSEALIPLQQDPLFDKKLVFRLGRTDSRKLDELIYGRG